MPSSYADRTAAQGAEIGRLCREHPRATVRSCPEWTGADLLAHVTGFAVWVTDVFAGGAEMATPIPDVLDPFDRWDDALARLLDALRTTDPDAPVPNWSVAPDTAAFWQRRAAQEFAVHRWDAATTAAAEPAPIPSELARDGIEEFLDVFVATAIAAGAAPADDATLALELTDHDVVLTRDLPRPGPVTRLRGTAPDLLLAVWHRRDPLEHFVAGDRARVESWPRI